MMSKGWKVSFFALAAVVALSACSEKKKHKNGNPYAGIWISQENLQEYSRYRGELNANNRRGFCNRVSENLDRYGDREYRMRAMLVQANGEVFRYRVGDSATSIGFRERNFMGTVNTAGQFLSGSIGPDGRVVSNWGDRSYSPYDMPAQTTLSIRGNVLEVTTESNVMTFERHNRIVAEDYASNVNRCLVTSRRIHEERVLIERRGGRGGRPGPVGPIGPQTRGPLPQDEKDFDPEVAGPGPAPGPQNDPRLNRPSASAPEQELGTPDDLGQDDQDAPPPIQTPRRRR